MIIQTAISIFLLAGITEARDSIEAQHTIADNIRAALVEENETKNRFSISERMEFYDVPGVSIAVIDDGEIAWAHGFGTLEDENDIPVSDTTLFQAASISKPITATGALRLVQEGELHLDNDVNDALTSWSLDWNKQNNEDIVTLRQLLNHTAGLSVHGFPGYADGTPIPELKDILDGSGGTNTEPVEVISPPDMYEQYSGGGYTILQQMIMDVTETEFDEVMEDYVLAPIGMKHSTFSQAAPDETGREIAHAHVAGSVVPGGYHRYPEKAAAGLWTTPTDLARWVQSIQRTANDEDETLISYTLLEEMMTPVHGNFGLGPQLEGSGDNLRFRHAGANHGYHADMVGYLHQGKGAVVMANADAGSYLIEEVLHSIAEYYEWPDYPDLRQRTFVTLPDQLLDEYAGTYLLPEGMLIELLVEDEQLYMEFDDTGRHRLLAHEEDHFFSPALNLERIEFVREQGDIRQMKIGPAGNEYTLDRIPD